MAVAVNRFGNPVGGAQASSVCTGVGGRLIRLTTANGSSPQPLSIALDLPNGDAIVDIGVAISVQADQRVQAQFQNVLSDAIFVTPFGDAPGEIRVTFVANNECEDNNGGSLKVVQTYLDNRLKPGNNTSLTPAVISIGNGAFYAFLTGLLLSASTSDVPVIQGTLVFTAWPQT